MMEALCRWTLKDDGATMKGVHLLIDWFDTLTRATRGDGGDGMGYGSWEGWGPLELLLDAKLGRVETAGAGTVAVRFRSFDPAWL